MNDMTNIAGIDVDATEAAGTDMAQRDQTQTPPSSLPGSSSAAPAPQKLQRFLELAVTGIISMAATLALVTALSPSHHQGAKPLVMLDADRAAETFVRSPGISDLDEQAFGDAVTRFHGALLKEMLRYGAKTGTVVLSGSAVLAGEVPDVTDLLTQNAIRGMK